MKRVANKKSTSLFLAIAVLFVSFLCGAGSFRVYKRAEATVVVTGTASIHFLDIGQGDCTIIVLPDGKTMIIDGGENKTATETKIKNYIAENLGEGFKYFDYAVLTHTDADHCGGLDAVLKAYPAREVYRPNVISNYVLNSQTYVDPGLAVTLDSGKDANEKFWTQTAVTSTGVDKKDTRAYRDFVEAAYAPNADFTPVVYMSDGRIIDRPVGKANQDIFGTSEHEYSVKFYSPLKFKYTDSNDCSTILAFSYLGRTVMLSGDAEAEAEAEFVSTYSSAEFEFNSDLIKLGHHGSRTSSSSAFLSKVAGLRTKSQIFTIISCGLGNSYGHPHSETLDRLESMGFSEDRILRTDLHGTIVVALYEREETVYIAADTENGPDFGEMPATTDPDPVDPDPTDTDPTDTDEFDILAWFDSLEPLHKGLIIGAAILIVIAVVIVVGKNNAQKKAKAKSSSKKKSSGKKKTKK